MVLHYQTKVRDLATREIRGLEALIRWDDPEHGLLSPMDLRAVARGVRTDRGRRQMGAQASGRPT